jgi:hypothetical protein
MAKTIRAHAIELAAIAVAVIQVVKSGNHDISASDGKTADRCGCIQRLIKGSPTRTSYAECPALAIRIVNDRCLLKQSLFRESPQRRVCGPEGDGPVAEQDPLIDRAGHCLIPCPNAREQR